MQLNEDFSKGHYLALVARGMGANPIFFRGGVRLRDRVFIRGRERLCKRA